MTDVTVLPPSEHALYGASGAHRWGHCAASLAFSLDMPNRTSAFAAEGTMGHEVAAECLQKGGDCIDYVGRKYQIDGFDLEFSDDHALALQTYVDAVRQAIDDIDDPALIVMIEERVFFGDFIDVEDQFGTGDVILVSPMHGFVEVHDLKFGQGQRVTANDNEQLALYALGAVNLARDYGFEVDRAALYIHQPRLSAGYSEWRVTVDELKAVAERLKAAAAKSEHAIALVKKGEDIPAEYFTPGDSQCLWCEAKALCDAAADYVFEAMGCECDDFEDLTHTGTSIAIEKARKSDGKRIGMLLTKLDYVERWASAVRQHAAGMLAMGEEVDGFKLVEGGRGHRFWLDPKRAEEALRSLGLTEDMLFDKKMRTPAQSEAALRKLFPDQKISKRLAGELIADYVDQPDGKPVMVQQDDPRPPMDTSDVSFDDIST